MGYYIYAWFENENLNYKSLRRESKSICLSWNYQATDANYDNKEIQRLFRDLLLLTCKQKMSNYRIFEVKPSVVDECIYPLRDDLACA